MSDRELLEEISETVQDQRLKVTAIRDQISDLLSDAGYLDLDSEEDADEAEED